MIIIDKPFVSDHVVQTILKNKFKVLKNQVSESILNEYPELLLSEDEAVRIFKDNLDRRIYTVSENSIEWVVKNLGFTGLPGKIDLFKNKVRFRDMTREIYPELFYSEVAADNLKNINADNLPLPVILKPAVGFFSMGVNKINSIEDWNNVVGTVAAELERFDELYPDEVLDIKSFIIEEYIEGDEYAIDAYFNKNGEPVILGIFKHIFSSNDDVGDRLYVTSRDIILDNLDLFTRFLKKIGTLAELKNFPLHTEVRINNSGEIVPIEINPLRFGAWCTTADVTWFSYQMNPYEYYFSDSVPDWEKILNDRDDKVYSMIVLDNTTGVKVEKINSFDHSKLLNNFSNIMEFREIDYKKYNVFGFVYTETRKRGGSELEWVLNSDLREFIS